MVMDINLALLSGRLAVSPLVETQHDGSRAARLLVYLRSPGRFDVIPVFVPDPLGALAAGGLDAGTRINLAGALSRVCSDEPCRRPGRIEVRAESYELPDVEDRIPGR
jgi:hypothetical protein